MWLIIGIIVLMLAAYGIINVTSNQIRGCLGAIMALIFLLGLQKKMYC